MRYLVISDIHANLEALQAVLAEAPAHDGVLCLGDVVGYGASPNECVAVLRSIPNLVALVGNHDLAAMGRIDLRLFNDQAAIAARWTNRRLTPENSQWLEGLCSSGHGPHAFLAHASPRDPVWEYMENASQGPPNFALFEEMLGFVGHTHVPRIFMMRPGQRRSEVSRPAPGTRISLGGTARWIINPGGVGQPRDGDPRAAYGMFDVDLLELRFWRAPYDVPRAQRKIKDAGLPEILAARLQYGL